MHFLVTSCILSLVKLAYKYACMLRTTAPYKATLGLDAKKSGSALYPFQPIPGPYAYNHLFLIAW